MYCCSNFDFNNLSYCGNVTYSERYLNFRRNNTLDINTFFCNFKCDSFTVYSYSENKYPVIKLNNNTYFINSDCFGRLKQSGITSGQILLYCFIGLILCCIIMCIFGYFSNGKVSTKTVEIDNKPDDYRIQGEINYHKEMNAKYGF